ncbi:unnamed protein product [Toxocara canis]|uniref:GILT-like protein F37H8.5 n=1 Tax=Toxocara canis TaxID=6265 RepID=A0A183VC01_TOXCA|nr:unnamed protein product [Toxocara canis]
MMLKLLIRLVVAFWMCQSVASKCELPSDFWCDHASIEAECGTARYCATYRRNMRNRPFNVKIFIDGNSTDSQRFVVEKLYPNLVSHPERATITLFPLASNSRSHKSAKCMSSDPGCNLNKLLSCATHNLNGDKLYHFVFCIEMNMKFNRTVEESTKSCYREVTTGREEEMIRYCLTSSEGNVNEASDEKMARVLRPSRHQFLPWISINDRSLGEMQVKSQVASIVVSMLYQTGNIVTARKWSLLREPSSTDCP